MPQAAQHHRLHAPLYEALRPSSSPSRFNRNGKMLDGKNNANIVSHNRNTDNINNGRAAAAAAAAAAAEQHRRHRPQQQPPWRRRQRRRRWRLRLAMAQQQQQQRPPQKRLLPPLAMATTTTSNGNGNGNGNGDGNGNNNNCGNGKGNNRNNIHPSWGRAHAQNTVRAEAEAGFRSSFETTMLNELNADISMKMKTWCTCEPQCNCYVTFDPSSDGPTQN